jgi:hypothetical protein
MENNMLEYKRLESTDIIYKDCNAMEVFNSIFNFGHSVNEDLWKDFFEHYEFFHIDETESVYLIVITNIVCEI